MRPPSSRSNRSFRGGLAALAAALLSAHTALGADPAPVGSCWPGPIGSDPALCPPNDPGFKRHWEFRGDLPPELDRTRLHPAELALGSIGFSLDRAWQRTIGRDDVTIAVLDSGIRWNERELLERLALNAGELPFPLGAPLHDANGDGRFDITDYAGDPRVTDRNGNGLVDPGDLIAVFTDGRDDDGNGYRDDICGYDFFGGPLDAASGADNDPGDDTEFGHGTGIARTAAASTNNGLGDAGVCPRCRILPVRIGDSFVVDANQFARGVAFAVRSKALVIATATGSYNNTPAARVALDRAYAAGVPVIASAADEFSYHHNYPSVNNHALYVNAIRHNDRDDPNHASTFWGVNPCTNFGARVWITVPANSCSSGATSRLAGVTGLLQSAALDAGLGSLHAEEVYQVLRATADDLDNSSPDWGALRYRARPGFDQYYGYGRLHADRAVAAVQERRIPPIVDLANPRWFAIVSPRDQPRVSVEATIRLRRAKSAGYRLEYALGVEPREEDYVLVSEGAIAGDLAGVVGTLDLQKLPLPTGPAPRNREERDRYSVSLRLHATDDRGLVAEARRSFFVLHDPSWKAGSPLDLDVSGEAGPLLTDLDGDGRDEIVLPTSDGRLRIVRWTAGGPESVLAPLDDRPAIEGDAPGRHAESVIRAAAVGDLAGDGRRAIVVASREGKVYAFGPGGERLRGFPVSIDRARSRPATAEQRIESGILTSPVLAELDGKPGLEILVAALDGHLYAWRHDGKPLAGFPVSLRNPASPGARAKLVSTPAVGDLDGDGRVEIVLGSNGLRDIRAAAFAVWADGERHPGGPFVPGWAPLEVPALQPDLLPTLATGIHMTPLVVDVDSDGDDEVLLYAVTGTYVMLVDQRGGRPEIAARYAMTPGAESALVSQTFLTGTGSGLVADTDRDGTSELYAPLLPFRMLTLRSKPGIPLDVPLALGGWELRRPTPERRTEPMLPSYPRRMEDLMIFAAPTAADVDGDGADEVLMGSGGYLLHAFRRGAGEAAGFPKFTGGWIFSAPAVGDLEGDGKLDLVAVTREGYLFVWGTEAPARPLPRPGTLTSQRAR